LAGGTQKRAEENAVVILEGRGEGGGREEAEGSINLTTRREKVPSFQCHKMILRPIIKDSI